MDRRPSRFTQTTTNNSTIPPSSFVSSQEYSRPRVVQSNGETVAAAAAVPPFVPSVPTVESVGDEVRFGDVSSGTLGIL